MFVFGDTTDYPSEYPDNGNLDFALRIKFLPETAKGIYCDKWPRLLREFRSTSGNSFKTSVDEFGNIEGFWSPEDGLREKTWLTNWHNAFPRRSFNRTTNSNKSRYIQMHSAEKEAKSCGWFKMFFNDIGLVSCIIQIKPKKGELYSRFYKMVQILDADYYVKKFYNSIKILWPIDCCGNQQIGNLKFQRYSHLSNHRIKAVLEVSYEFDQSFKLFFRPKHIDLDIQNIINVQLTAGQPNLLFIDNPPPPPEQVGNAFSKLYSDFLKIWEHSVKSGAKNLDLREIIGDNLFRRPPTDLFQIFTGEYPDFRELV